MPEIPDLNIFQSNLAKNLVGEQLNRLTILIERQLKEPQAAFKSALEGQVLTAVNRVGKQLYFVFANNHVLGLHLMLHGAMHWYGTRNENKFTIAELDFSGAKGLAITDWQKAVKLSLDPEISQVPDAMELPENYLASTLKNNSRPIKTVLTEGKVVQGIGNAYVDEILYDANLSPFSIAGKIPEKKITVLAHSIKSVLEEAEAHIRGQFPDTITEKERDFLKVHLPKHKITPKGEPILVAEIAKRKTYYTEGQELFD